MTAEDALSRHTAPPLVVRTQGSGRTLQAGPVYLIGRDPAADITVDEPLVSWRHAVLKIADDQWLLEDAASTNGTFADGERIQRVDITDSCQVRSSLARSQPPQIPPPRGYLLRRRYGLASGRGQVAGTQAPSCRCRSRSCI
jgi:pSer/pThr/pTyr-binding forkhead associated (FHA) protein